MALECDEQDNNASYFACVNRKQLQAYDASTGSNESACSHIKQLLACMPNPCCSNTAAKEHVKQVETELGAHLSRSCQRGWAPCPNNRMTPEEFESHAAEFLEAPSVLDAKLSVAERYPDHIGWDGARLRFAAISVASKSLRIWDEPPEDFTRRQYELYDALRVNIDDIAYEACGARVMMTDMDGKFVFMNNQRIYRTSAVRGALIGLGIAFCVLLLCTWSLTISLLSSLSILCTMISVIGLTTMMGWTLGTTEAIQISILAGFSVDYVVHLAHAYASSNAATREERVVAAFSDMGSPVMSGMITSVLASLPLFLCTITFFAKFGTFLCLTIGFSWIFANFGFMSLLASIGPQNRSRGTGLDHAARDGSDPQGTHEEQKQVTPSNCFLQRTNSGRQLLTVLPGLDPKAW